MTQPDNGTHRDRPNKLQRFRLTSSARHRETLEAVQKISKGWTDQDIRDEIRERYAAQGMSRQAAQRIVDSANKRIARLRVKEAPVLRARQSAKLDRVQRHSFEAKDFGSFISAIREQNRIEGLVQNEKVEVIVRGVEIFAVQLVSIVKREVTDPDTLRRIGEGIDTLIGEARESADPAFAELATDGPD
jgi:hypothetical protein